MCIYCVCYWVELHPRLDSEPPRLLRAWSGSPGLSGGINAYLTPPGAECKTTSFPLGCFPEGVEISPVQTGFDFSRPQGRLESLLTSMTTMWWYCILDHLGWEHDTWHVLRIAETSCCAQLCQGNWQDPNVGPFLRIHVLPLEPPLPCNAMMWCICHKARGSLASVHKIHKNQKNIKNQFV